MLNAENCIVQLNRILVNTIMYYYLIYQLQYWYRDVVGTNHIIDEYTYYQKLKRLD